MTIPSIGLEDFEVGLEGIRYEHYYRKHGIRTFPLLLAPRFSSIENLEMPLESVLHYLPELTTELGIMPNNVFLRNHAGAILIDHVETLIEPEGTPMLTSARANKLTLEYRRAARSIRPLRNYATGFRNGTTLVVENYCFINHLYRYRNTFMTRIFKFRNLMRVFISKLNEIAAITKRKQYVEIRLPAKQLTLRSFHTASKRFNRQTMSWFHDDKSLMLLELWKFLAEDRSDSLFDDLTPEAKESIQFVFIETGKYTVLSLELLEKIRGTIEDPTVRVRKPIQIQIAFYKFLSAIYELRSVGEKQVIEIVTDEDGEEKAITHDADGNEIQVDVETEEELEALTAELPEDNEPSEADLDYELSEEELDTGVQDSEIYVVPKEQPPTIAELEQVVHDPVAVGVVTESKKMLDLGLISVAAHERNIRLANSYKNIKNPWGTGNLEDACKIDPEALKIKETQLIPDISYVMDKSMLKSSIRNFDKDYVEVAYNADIASMVLNLQRSGVIIHDYRVEEYEDVNNHYDVHYVQLSLVNGKVTTVPIKVPRVNKNGVFRSRGTNYRLRKQRVDIPIRKTSDKDVGLTSYVSKVSVSRSPMVVHDYSEWLKGQVLKGIKNNAITEVKFSNVFDQRYKFPLVYTAMAKRYSSFNIDVTVGTTVHQIKFNWDFKSFEPSLVDSYTQNGLYPCGYVGDKLVVLDELGIVSFAENSAAIGSLEEILGADGNKAPIETVTIKVLDKKLPMSFVLSYYMGLTEYLKFLNVPYRIVAKGNRLDLSPDEFAVKFADSSIVLNRNHPKSVLFMSGFRMYHQSIKKYPLMEFDSPDVYGAVLDSEGISGRYLRELEIMRDLWVDPITRSILEERKEPTEWIDILVYATTLLLTDQHPRMNAGKKRRTRGYERISGHVYSEMVRAVRKAKARPISAKAAIELNPNAVWMSIQQDSSMGISNEINPLEELKETELMTFTGTGGRSAMTMTRPTRGFDPDDLGLVSEAGVDNANVAITTFSSPDPIYANLRGMVHDWDFDPEQTAKILSTASLIGVGATHDDMKRAVFSYIQHSHAVEVVGYEISPLQTGYESVVAHRTSEMYSYVASGDGKIVHVDDVHMIVEYDDPDKPTEKVQLGTRYGVSTGHVIRHDLVCDLKAGTKVKKGHVLAYHSGFFGRSIIDPTQVIWKTGALGTFMIVDDADTLEDSSILMDHFAAKLERPTVHYEEIIFRADQGISDLVQVGDAVEIETILCNKEDPVAASGNLFDDETRDSLRLLAASTPTAGVQGVVAKIEVTYNADQEELSPSLFALINKSDKERAKLAKTLGKKVLTGKVSDLDMDTVKVGIYIHRKTGMADGDKLVLGNQLKSVVKAVRNGVLETVSGQQLDGKFGALSIDARMVDGALLSGTTVVLVELANQRAAAAYRNK